VAERLSNWSQYMRAVWLRDARCPNCEAMNIKGSKPTVELADDTYDAYCNTCGHAWVAERPPVNPVA
jgi:transcription elongation factor Elf1